MNKYCNSFDIKDGIKTILISFLISRCFNRFLLRDLEPTRFTLITSIDNKIKSRTRSEEMKTAEFSKRREDLLTPAYASAEIQLL